MPDSSSRSVRFVSLPGIGGIAQTVATELLARLADPSLSDADFEELQAEARAKGYRLEAA